MILTSLQITIAKYALILSAMFGIYIYGKYQGKLECSSIVNQVSVNALKKQQIDERKQTTHAVKRASDTAKRIQEIKEEGNKHVQHLEENISRSCPLTTDSLHELKAIVDRSRQISTP